MPATKTSVAPKKVTPTRKTTTTKKTAVKAAIKTAPVKKAEPKAVKAVKAEPVVEEPVVEEGDKVEVKAKKRRLRPRQRAYDEIYPDLEAKLTTAYKALQESRKLLSQLNTAHKKAVSNSKTHQNVTRTPTILFDQDLVDYFLSRLDGAELSVHRRNNGEEEEVSLADLSTETRVHRTDVTQLFTKVFKKHDMLDNDDRRVILYQNDADLVALLTSGDYNAKYQEDIDAINDGSHRLTIFNIQRVTSQHLGKVELPKKDAVVVETEA